MENKYWLISQAIKKNDLEGLKKILDTGVHPDDKEFKEANTPLYHACRKKREEIAIELIRRGADYQYVIERDRNIFLLAVEKGLCKVVKFLLDKDKGLINQTTSSHGSNAFHHAAAFGQMEMMKLLIEYGIDVNLKSDGGFDALMNACMGDNLEAIKFLVELGFDPNVKNDYDDTCISHVAFRKHSQIVQYFLSNIHLLNEENVRKLNRVRLETIF
jgi:hypothetical protein